jgi:N4-gp56 family major capsid protein
MVATANMVTTPAIAGLVPVSWTSDYFSEYVRTNQFSRYFGEDENAMIQLRMDLTRKPGDRVAFGAVRRLAGAGVTGSTVLQGQEETLNMRSLTVLVDVIRHGVASTEWDEQKSVIDILDAARAGLLTWDKEKLRTDIITAMGKLGIDGGTSLTYAAASAGQRNSWLVNNTDRVLFGALVANHVSGVMATSLTTLDTTADKMSGAILSLAKRRAKIASPHIRPIRVNNDEEWFVCFMPSYVFRDFRSDTNVINAQYYAANRGSDNPLFTGGDLVWDGVIVREIPEMGVIAGAGAGGTTDVARSYLCGAGAVGIAWAQRPQVRHQDQDYQFSRGVAIQEIRGIDKLRFGIDASVDLTAPVDNGIFTIFTTAVSDA